MFPRALSYHLIRLSLDLYAQVAYENAGKNIVFSPFGVGTVLCMLLGGARNDTAAQLAEALHTSLDDTLIQEEFAALLRQLLTNSGEVTFRVANRMYSANHLLVRPEYRSLLESRYMATIETMDFERDSEAIRRAANDWVSEQTEHKIRDLLPTGSVDESTVMILINAIYMKAYWQTVFDARETKLQDFYLDSKNSVQVDMMYKESKYRVGRSDKLMCRALEMPYRGGRFSMIILLPNHVEGLSYLENNLRASNLYTLLKSLELETNVYLSVPKFEVKLGLNLRSSLKGLGIDDLFQFGLADLTGIFRNSGYKVSSIFHDTLVHVNENGTEALSGTTVLVIPVDGPDYDHRTVFRVDHPFMFLITTKDMDAILFMGSVRDFPH